MSSEIEFSDLLLGKEDTILEATNELGRLWRYVLYQLKPSYAHWDSLMDRFCLLSNARLPGQETVAQSVKGNIVSALAKEDLTWATFIKGMMVFNYDKVVTRWSFYGTYDYMPPIRVDAPILTIKQAIADIEKDSKDITDMATINEYVNKNIAANTHAITVIYQEYRDIITDEVFTAKVKEYAVNEADRINKLGDEPTTPTRIEGSFNKNLKRDDISWKTFMHMLKATGVNSIGLSIELYSIRNIVLEVSIAV